MLHTIETVRPYVLDCVRAGQPVMIHGRAGTGKSDLARSVARELFDGRFIDTRAPNHEPQDIAGLPAIDLGARRVSLLPLEIMPNADRDGPSGLWMLDELNRATRQMQNVLLGLILDGYAGGYVKPAGWSIMAAGNIASERAFIEPMDPALKARLEHFYIQADVAEFIAWGERNGINPALLAFLRHAPELIYTDSRDGEHAAANPRAYAQLSRVMDGAPRDRWAGHCRAKCGSIAAERFAAFMMIWERLPPLPYIVANPDSAPVPAPNEPGLLYALANALARIAEPSNFPAVLQYLERLPREFGIAAVTAATGRAPALKETGSYVQWAIRNQIVTL